MRLVSDHGSQTLLKKDARYAEQGHITKNCQLKKIKSIDIR
jgi:hypothetical protein